MLFFLSNQLSNVIKGMVIMSFRTRIFGIFTAVLVVFAYPPASHADSETKHVFELFTSQSCYSCPPAESLLTRIVEENEEVLALEFHVDYWDTLVYGSAGQWKDPYSSPEYSQRQRNYNRMRLAGRTGVYTPQMVVNGSYAFVGSRSLQAQNLISKASELQLQASAKVSEDGQLTIKVDGDHSAKADVWLVTFDRHHVTEIPSGENMGKTLTNSNVVRDFRSIGQWQGEPLVIESELEPLSDNQGCAIIIQQYNAFQARITGPILGAAKCESA